VLITRRALESTDVFVVWQAPFGWRKSEKVFLIPADVFREVFPRDRDEHNFYVPYERGNTESRKIDWFSYLSRWEVFRDPTKEETSATG